MTAPFYEWRCTRLDVTGVDKGGGQGAQPPNGRAKKIVKIEGLLSASS